LSTIFFVFFVDPIMGHPPIEKSDASFCGGEKVPHLPMKNFRGVWDKIPAGSKNKSNLLFAKPQ